MIRTWLSTITVQVGGRVTSAALVNLAETRAEALGTALLQAREEYPASAGYHTHQATATDISPLVWRSARMMARDIECTIALLEQGDPAKALEMLQAALCYFRNSVGLAAGESLAELDKTE